VYVSHSVLSKKYSLQKTVWFFVKVSGSVTNFNKFVWIPNIFVTYPEDDSDKRAKHIDEQTVNDKHISQVCNCWCCYVN
jgi:hypothetical protein